MQDGSRKQERCVAAVQDRRSIQDFPKLICEVCGYGVSVQSPPEACPMCQSEAPWTELIIRRGKPLDANALER